MNGTHDRVRQNTSDDINKEIDRRSAIRVREYAGLSKEELTRKIEELDQEWDIERLLETNASIIGLTGLVLSMTHSRKWIAVPSIVLPFLLQHAVQGWCPPVPVFRRLGFRTRKEIDREKHALKYLRGDYDEWSELRPDVAAFRSASS